MTILVEPTATGFRAETGGPLNLSATGLSSNDAVAALQSIIATRLRSGTMIVKLPMPSSLSPIPVIPLAENPLVDQWLAAVKDYRNQCEAEDQATYSAGN